MTKRLKVGLIGAGAMGANHARVVATSLSADLTVVVDPVAEQAERLADSAGAAAAPDHTALYGCDAAIVACPTEHHASIALDLLDRGIPLLVEKPLASELSQVEKLIDAAERQDIPLTCGFVERFNAAVTTAVGLLDEPPIHILSTRHSPPTPRIATSVVYDLLIHDIDLAMRLVPHSSVEAAVGAAPVDAATGTAEVADCILRFSSGAVGTLSASRVSQRKIRSLLVSTSTELFDVDLLRQDVTVYRNVRQGQGGSPPGYQAETIIDIPFVRHAGEPLALQFEHFVRLVHGDVDPVVERASLLAPHLVAAEIDGTAIGRPTALTGATK